MWTALNFHHGSLRPANRWVCSDVTLHHFQERKKAVKEQKAEKRKNKVKKHIKKRKEKENKKR